MTGAFSHSKTIINVCLKFGGCIGRKILGVYEKRARGLTGDRDSCLVFIGGNGDGREYEPIPNLF